MRDAGVASPLAGLAFRDPNHGAAVGDGGRIMSTEDGGASWSRTESSTRADLRGVAFFGRSGVAAGAAATILTTGDGGATWRARDKLAATTLRGVAFANDASAWVVGDAGVILATADGGATA